ncbi:ABC transporter ATP-binding protein [Herbiconiux daphne]|uniref:ABC transporter ATP-binding protein n=1 Tax=Herbiconiux daphne TaxID=2970914 RepID=A0ABT2H3N7_9MICO|nr:ABC transporter ATP-binding protein [Herbiconiux daphne]MCS5734517.1 ABC transporter ATP-binding protein [Herbiconiux daphne]
MSGVRIAGLRKEYGSAVAVQDIDLDIAPGEFVALLGPSGCGKTTTLRCLAGLEVPTRGEISIGEKPVFSAEKSLFVPPEKRKIGMVFQSYALWPHMTVGANVGYPLKLAKVDKKTAAGQVQDLLQRVHLGDRTSQMAVALSGGQQQRVALARAMVNRPAVMLFDEPLSNLDAKLRLSMRAQIRELHDEFGTTSVYVTHDQEEAIALADRVVVMNAGLIEQLGTPTQLYTRPASAFVADFMGFQNVLPARVESVLPGELVVSLTGTPSLLRLHDDSGRWGPGDEIAIAFRSGHVRVRIGDSTSPGVLRGRVRRTSYLGSSQRVLVDVGGVAIRAQVDEGEFALFGPDDLAPGREVDLEISADTIVPLAAAGAPVAASTAPVGV